MPDICLPSEPINIDFSPKHCCNISYRPDIDCTTPMANLEMHTRAPGPVPHGGGPNAWQVASSIKGMVCRWLEKIVHGSMTSMPAQEAVDSNLENRWKCWRPTPH